MWNSIYDNFVQKLAGLRWSAFLAQNNNNIAQATRMRNVFRNDLYAISGLMIIAVTVCMAVVYYFILNRKGGAGYAFRVKFWFSALLANSLVISGSVLFISMSMTRTYSSLNPFKYCLSLGFVNLVYSAVLFFVLSLIFKKYSVASTTPF